MDSVMTLIWGAVVLCWGLYECVFRLSTFGSARYTPEENGSFFWAFALFKIVLGIVLIILGQRRFGMLS
jgi:hypothetical protein